MTKFIVLASAVIATVGCHKYLPAPPPTWVEHSSAGLPKFKLVKVLTGNLDWVGPNNDFVVRVAPASEHNKNTPNDPLPVGFSRNRGYGSSYFGASHVVWTAEKTSPMAERAYFDSKGHIALYPESQAIQINDGRKKVNIVPLVIRTDTVRYYQGNRAIYASDRKTGAIRKVYDTHEAPGDYIAKGDLLFFLDGLADGTVNLVRIDPVGDARIIYHGTDGYRTEIFHVSDDEKVTMHFGKTFCSIDPNGKSTVVPNASFDLGHFKFKGADYLVGFTFYSNSEFQDGVNSAAIWNKSGEPIKLSALCPEFQKAIVRVKQMYIGKVMSSNNGLLAVEMSGTNPVPEDKLHHVLDQMEQINRVYILKAIDQP
ncbi:MAG: hypothetical protein WCG75_02190 [Armatimonadota bacterium]